MANLNERLVRGEQSAFAELYDLCADRLHHYLVVRLGSRENADDVLQETFVRAARSRKRFADVENIVAYMLTVTRHEAERFIQQKRRRSRRLIRPLDADALFRCSGNGPGHNSEAADFAAAALSRLSAEQREVVELKIYAGLTFREIADVTKSPQGTVATRYRSALARIRQRYGSEQE